MEDAQLVDRNILKLAGDPRAILNKSQTSTTRYGLRRYTLGSALLVDGRREVRIFITMLEVLLFRNLGHGHARTEGYTNAFAMMSKIRRFYPHIRDGDQVTYVRFELVEDNQERRAERPRRFGRFGR